MELHMYGSILALLFLLPLALITEGSGMWNAYIPRQIDTVDANGVHSNVLSTPLHLPVMGIIFSCVCLYGQTMASLFLLERVTTVAHQVANTSKRFFIILFSILYFGNVVTFYNGLGMALALVGFFMQKPQKKHDFGNYRKMHDEKTISNNVHSNADTTCSSSAPFELITITTEHQNLRNGNIVASPTTTATTTSAVTADPSLHRNTVLSHRHLSQSKAGRNKDLMDFSSVSLPGGD
ncbi:hypothetical protein RFI_18635 [Reticulomyxa filosa]|uniref:Sugar phosphate transporter domain-containing protein n=1 Tax=Reticulomyxa filosa TaxID=46433 RepID=X6MZY1_RETFI|nr:hypothetical protein RFI_18635 [Reticulomyxa filosa]|eukprot:ETO18627.1 hypothetical protein RFI_18635 [Reticulomyxa filosa]